MVLLTRASIIFDIIHNLNDRCYHVPDNYDVAHSTVKMCCKSTQFPTVPSCEPQTRIYIVCGLSKYKNLRLYPKL